MGARTCACGCGRPIPEDMRSDAKYLDKKHRARAHQRRYRRRKRDQSKDLRIDAKPTGELSRSYKGRDESDDGRASARRGRGYNAIRQYAAWRDYVSGEKTQSELIVEIGDDWDSDLPDLSGANLSRWAAAQVEDDARDHRRETHEPDLSHTDDLGSFTRRYFPKLLVPDFHLEWEADIDEVVGTGGRLLLLAPQRFGKSEMLIRYCIKRIARDPNICIGWVSKTASLAERMVGYVRQHLEHNEKFIADVLGEGGSFVPPTRSGYSWTNGEFTVANRTELRKSPTMTALGVGGTIVGQDFDLVILDDPQDRARCMSPSQREKDVEWMFTDFLSRKEEHTGVAFIMSRQHMEDLPGHILRDHADDWEVRIYRAHDPACPLPEADVKAHDECVLWPEKRSWGWLYRQKQANEAHFQRNYMNDPKTDATTYISSDEIAAVRDHTRRVGDIPEGSRLVAGIDPAESKPVAAVLWGYDGMFRHVIDCGEFSASVVGLREVLSTWPQRYGVREFAFEKNMAKSWLLDEEVKRLITEQRLTVHQHYTDRINKNSNAIGPVAMFQRLRTSPPEITLPGAPGEGQDRIDRLVRTWLMFDPDWANGKHADDDLVMASWFPQLVIDSWIRRPSSSMTVNYESFANPLGGF